MQRTIMLLGAPDTPCCTLVQPYFLYMSLGRTEK